MLFSVSFSLRRFFLIAAAFCSAMTNFGATAEEITLYYNIDKSQPGSQVTDFESILTVVNERLSGLGRAFQTGEDQIGVRVSDKLDLKHLDKVKRRLTRGEIKLHFYVDSLGESNRKVIDQALASSWQQQRNKAVNTEWLLLSTYSPRFHRDNCLVVRTRQSQSQVLTWIVKSQLSGEYLMSASKAIDGQDNPVLSITLNSEGQSILNEQADFLRSDKGQEKLTCGFFVDGKAYGAAVVTELKEKPLDFIGLPEETIDELLVILKAGILPYSLREVSATPK